MIDADEKMEFDYSATQSQLLIMLCRIVQTIDIEEFVSRIGTCEAIAPIFNPTLYLKGCEKLSHIKTLAAAALRFQEKINEVKELINNNSQIENVDDIRHTNRAGGPG